MKIKNNEIILFQGDSVTDAGRIKGNSEQMGMGYPKIVSAIFSSLHPELDVKFINRGVSGNRVRDLRERWNEDCLDLKPTWVSILVGINDCWRRYDSNDPTEVEKFKEDYRYILQKTKDNLNANLILCEPFLLPVPEDRRKWREDLDPKINAIRELAREFKAIYVPLDGLFTKVSISKEPSFWTPDGVHPSAAGHSLIAKAWLNAVEAL